MAAVCCVTGVMAPNVQPSAAELRPAGSEEAPGVHCPFCRHGDTRVIDSRIGDDGSAIRRRRQCPACQRRFSTLETSSLAVVKRSGVVEPFSRDKVVAGVRKACQGRPVSDDDLALLAQQVEETVRASASAQVDAHEVGRAILGPLRVLDEVAYLRFASVYSDFASLTDFEQAISALRAQNVATHEEADAGHEEADAAPVEASGVGNSDRAAPADNLDTAAAQSSRVGNVEGNSTPSH